ncbi:phosphotransferase [Arthrobacter sp. CAL618]|uniref:phosphotransferase n=1 Tax=Arthrobacter sp. CAL618 TaxID=1055770 RepID=UPI0012EBAA3E|nr:phosphotransferase [Arthrobacter sp. CAL618]
MTTIPATLTDRAGRQLNVHRAWPRDGGRLTFEAMDTDGGQIRAGTIEADGVVRLAPFAEDPVLSGLPGAAALGQLLVHRYKRRAVVRDNAGFTKLLAPGKAEGVAVAHRWMRTLAHPSGIVVPDVVVQHPGSVTLTAVHGTSLHELGRGSTAGRHADGASSGDGDAPSDGPGNDGGIDTSAGIGILAETSIWDVAGTWEMAWQQWAQLWPRLAVAQDRFEPGSVGQESVGQGSVALPAHTARDECHTVARWVNQVQEFEALPVAPARLQRASAQVARLLISGVPQQAVLSHRDLHDKQLLFNPDSGAVGLIDCDTVSVAEPALDLANLLVHVDFRRAQGVYSAAAAQTAKQAVLTAADAIGVSDQRLEAYAAATRLRLACLYAFRPQYRALAHQWFEGLEIKLAETTAA